MLPPVVYVYPFSCRHPNTSSGQFKLHTESDVQNSYMYNYNNNYYYTE